MSSHDLVLVVDFGAQYAQLIARRVREAKVYSEIVPHSMPVAEMLARKPAAIILSGGPQSVYAEGAPRVDPALFEAGVPVFGICYGFQAMAQALGGEVGGPGLREFGRTAVRVRDAGTLLRRSAGPADGLDVATATRSPPRRRASPCWPRSDGAPVAAFEDAARRLAGVQFHPEVLHTEHGQQVLERFLYDIAGCRPDLDAGNVIDEQVAAIRAQVGDKQVHLRAVRRRRLRGGRSAGAQGDRRPAHLRLRRPRPAARGRGRAGREGLRRGDRHPAQGGRRGRARS